MKKETRRLVIRGICFVLYLVIGMVVFRKLESHNETIGKLKAKQAIDEMLTKYNISHDEMKAFVRIITEAEAWGYTNGWIEKWSYTGSLFFSGTVITTIGYGHFAPRTLPGRLFCMAYALFGIPITWLMLTSLGRQIVEQIESLLQNRNCSPESCLYNFLCLLIAMALGLLLMVAIAVGGVFAEDWTFFEGMYFAFISLTTIGFGDYTPIHPNYDPQSKEQSSINISVFVLFCLLVFSFGLAVTTSVLLSIRKIMEDQSIIGFHSLYSSGSDNEDDENRVEEQYEQDINSNET